MLRSSFVIFIIGWVVWFMLDKPGAVQFSFAQRDPDLLGNFQYAFDMLKAGYPGPAFIFIWKQHYIVLSLLGGALLAVGAGMLGDYLGRRRMRRRVLPGAARQSGTAGNTGETGPRAAPTEHPDLVSDKRVE
ncbi:MAG: hypothetical protein WBO34_06990, partial [Gammaproteobacteria bacterium]